MDEYYDDARVTLGDGEIALVDRLPRVRHRSRTRPIAGRRQHAEQGDDERALPLHVGAAARGRGARAR